MFCPSLSIYNRQLYITMYSISSHQCLSSHFNGPTTVFVDAWQHFVNRNFTLYISPQIGFLSMLIIWTAAHLPTVSTPSNINWYHSTFHVLWNVKQPNYMMQNSMNNMRARHCLGLLGRGRQLVAGGAWGWVEWGNVIRCSLSALQVL